MSPVVESRLMSAEEFLALPDDGIERDLLYGVVREWGKTIFRRGVAHCRVAARLAFLLENWRREQPQPRGSVHAGAVGCHLQQNPDAVLGIDLVYLSPSVLAQQSDESDIIEGPPTLAIEIFSPSNLIEEINLRVGIYRDMGIPLIWLVDPYLRTVTVVRPDAPPKMFNVTQELTAEPHLPGFRVRVADIFR